MINIQTGSVSVLNTCHTLRSTLTAMSKLWQAPAFMVWAPVRWVLTVCQSLTPGSGTVTLNILIIGNCLIYLFSLVTRQHPTKNKPTAMSVKLMVFIELKIYISKRGRLLDLHRARVSWSCLVAIMWQTTPTKPNRLFCTVLALYSCLRFECIFYVWRVNGVKSLRVVDASIMPRVVTANTQGPVMMIAERAADFILEDHEKSWVTLLRE